MAAVLVPFVVIGGGDGSEDRHFRVRFALSGHDKFVSSPAFSPDGSKTATGSSDSTAKMWNASTGALITTLNGHTKSTHGRAARDGVRTAGVVAGGLARQRAESRRRITELHEALAEVQSRLEAEEDRLPRLVINQSYTRSGSSVPLAGEEVG
ncbi:hypothetical protein ABT299_49315 [Spirillospora sp. NPDC000708]